MRGKAFLCFYVFVLSALISSQQLLAAQFKYDINSYPKVDANCHITAKNLGVIFSSASGLEVKSAFCKEENEFGSNIQITYLADDKVDTVTTDDLIFSLYHRGSFDSYETCNNAIEVEAQKFTTATGLVPFLKFCYKVKLTENRPWELRLDAIGDSVVRPFFSGHLISSYPVSMEFASLEQEVRDALIRKGLNLSYVVVRSRGLEVEITARYYSAEEIEFDDKTYCEAIRKEDCLSQLPDLNSIFQISGFSPVVSYVGRTYIGTEMNVISIENEPFTVSPSVEKFATFQECLSGKAALIEFYKNELGRNIIGGICTSNKEIKVNLFEQ